MEKYSHTYLYAKGHYKTHSTMRDLQHVMSADLSYGVTAPEAMKHLLELAKGEEYDELHKKYDELQSALMVLQWRKVKDLDKPDFELLPQAKAPFDVSWLLTKQ